MSAMAIYRQLSLEPDLWLAVDFLHIHKSLTWTRDCHAEDLPLASDYRPDNGPEQPGEVQDLLEFLPLFAEVNGVSIFRVLLKQCCSGGYNLPVNRPEPEAQ